MARNTDGAVVRPLYSGGGGAFGAARAFISTVRDTDWFGPLQPVAPQAPPGTQARDLDYPVGYNLQYIPRGEEDVTFQQLRNLASMWWLVATVIETRKDQVAAVPWVIRAQRQPNETNSAFKARTLDDPIARKLKTRFQKPDGELLWQTWVRKLLHEVLVTDALAILPSTRDGDTYLDIMDGTTIKRVIDTQGRTPKPPDKAYQQIIKGVPAIDFTTDELVYRPRNVRADKIYGFSPVEQLIVMINLGLRREFYKLSYYTEGNLPEAIVQMPDNWPIDKIKQFQEWFNSVLAGQVDQRRKAFFIPSIGGAGAISYPKQDAIKDEMDEWLARVVCYCFSVSAQPFIREMARATAETAQEAAKSEGLAPILSWTAEMFTSLIQGPLGQPGYEWVWQGDVEPDPLKRANIQALQVRNGIRGVDEVREDNGDDPIGVGAGIVTATGFVPFGQSASPDDETDPAAEQDPEHAHEEPVQKRLGRPRGLTTAFSTPKARKRLSATTRLLERFLAAEGKKASKALATAYAARQQHLLTTGNGNGTHA